MCMAKETKQNGSRDGEKSIRAWCYLFLLDDDEDDDDFDDDDGDAAPAFTAYCFAIDSQRCIDTRSSFYFISFSLIFGCILIFPLLFLNCFHALSRSPSLSSILVASSKLMDLRKSVCTVVCHRAFAVYFAFDFQMKIMCFCVCMCSRLEETGDE